jgi:DNA polymerase III subunit delta'
MIRTNGAYEVIGAQRALTYFGSLQPEQLAHGYLFTGPSGVGKKTFARRLAQSLFCREEKSGILGYDDTCPACIAFHAGSYPDYYESGGTIVIGGRDAPAAASDADDDDEGADAQSRWSHAESIRDKDRMEARGLIRELQLRPYSGTWRVVLLGDAEFATPDAANALLRFFEEPPPFVIILLTTDAPHSLLPTIRSRLIEIPFAPLSKDEVVGVLRGEGVSAEDAAFAAAAAMGSITRARAILEGAVGGLRETAIVWLEAVLRGRVPDTSFIDGLKSAGEKREAARSLIEFARTFVRDWAALTVAGKDAPLLAGDLRKRVERLPKVSPETAVGALGAVADAQQIALSNVSGPLVLDYLRLQLTPQ